MQLGYPYNSIQGLAFNQETGELYSVRLGHIWIINPFLGTVNQPFDTGFYNIRDLTFIRRARAPLVIDPNPTYILEPSTLFLLGSGLAGGSLEKVERVDCTRYETLPVLSL